MAFFSSRKRVLVAGNEGVALFGPVSFGGLEREITLPWDVPNFNAQLTNALTQKHAGSSLVILFDGDHTYRKGEGIPKLSYFDRPLFLKRKLDQAFPNYPVRASFEVAAAKGAGEAKEPPSYLFIAISETERLDKLSASLLDSGVPISGLGLLPIESQNLVTLLSETIFGQKNRKSRWAILIGQHETGGLRQVVVKDGQLALTRMTPLTEAGAQGPAWADEVMREFKATLTYLSRFGYTAGEGLDVIVIGGDSEKQHFEAQKFLPGGNFRCVKVTEALQMVGSKVAFKSEGNFSDILHAAWASKKRALVAPVKVESIHRIMMPRLAARIAVGVLLLTAIGFFGFTFVEQRQYNVLSEERTAKEGQKKVLTLEYDQEAKVFDVYKIKPDVIKSVLASKEKLDTSNINIAPILHRLKQAFGTDIKVNLLRFEYISPFGDKVTTDLNDQLGAGEEGGQPVPTPDVSDSGAEGAVSPVNQPVVDRGQVKMFIRFTTTTHVTLQEKNQTSQRLVEALKGLFTGYDVDLVKRFGNVSATGQFSGSVGDTSQQTDSGEEANLNTDGFAEVVMSGVPL